VWEGQVKEGRNYKYQADKKPGRQYLCEATALKTIESGKYDFVLASHMLEHIANPLKALFEWKRVLKKGGFLLLVLPKKEETFDHRRPVTTFQHLLEDFEKETGEDDLTHLPEILKLHDLSRDEAAGSFKQFKARSLKNFRNRCLHHHVFDEALLRQIFNFLNLKSLFITQAASLHLVAMAEN